METIRSATTHYIEPGKFLLLENALGNPDLIQCSVSSDCRVTIVDQNNFPLDELEQWPVFQLTTSDIKLNNGDGPYNIYLVVPTADNTVTGSASIGYSIYSIDRDGYRITEDGKKELVGSPRYKYYYTGSVSAQGGKPDAETTPAEKGRVIEMDLGVTPPATDIPGSLYDYDKIFEIDKVDPSNSNTWLLTILSVIKKMTVRVINVTSKLVFQKGNDSKELTDVAVDKDSGVDSKVENDIIASTAWVNKEFERNTSLYDAKYLFKDREDSTNFLLKLLGGVITDKIESQNFISGALGTGFQVKRDPKTGRSYAEFDEIYVRLKAVFESLTIKELQSVGGEILLTLASIECTKVEDSSAVPTYDSENARLYDSDGKALFVPKVENGVYRCYFTADDGEKAIINQFAVGDLAQCRQFNIKEGAYTGVSNRYYWRYVVAVGDNYIDLSVDDCAEGSDIPQAGDKIIQLGHRTDPARQNAILLSAYGLTAPTIQMLQGINSYSLDGKAVKEEGFDQETQQFYSKNYGRSYIGTKERTSYIEYTPENGVEMNNGTIKLHLDENNVWEVNKKCINIIGDKNGKHIEINPETRSIDIFDEKNNKVTTLDGSNYVGRDFWGGDMPVLSIINIPIEIEGTTGFGVLWNYSLCERIHITNTTTELKYGLIADIAITGDDSKDYISMSFEIQVYPDMTSNTPSNTIVIEKIKKEKDFTGTLINVESSIVLPMGFVEVKCSGSARKSDYNNVNTLKVRRYITSLVTNVYISKYFANGLVLGDSSNNIFSVINEDDTDTLTGQETRLDIHAYNYYSGIKIVRNGVFLKNNQHWGVMPSVIFNGRVWGSAQARLDGGKSWNGDFPTMTRESTGTYKFVFPSSWDSLSLTLNKYYLLLTPIATTGSATHLAVYHMEISHFIVTSVSINNAVFQNADFWIEMKWMN